MDKGSITKYKKRTKPPAKTKTAAVLTIFNAGEMTDQGIKDIAAWMTRQRKHFLAYGKQYDSKRFTARYCYVPGDDT